MKINLHKVSSSLWESFLYLLIVFAFTLLVIDMSSCKKAEPIEAVDDKYSFIFENDSAQKPLTPFQMLCGNGSKSWLMTEYILDGTVTPYNVVSVLNADSTWTDSNNRSGLWWFTDNNTKITYDYSESGMVVTFDIAELRIDFIRLTGTQFGMAVEMSMIPVE